MLKVTDEHGEPVKFDCPDTLESKWTCRGILQGRTYPALPFLRDVRVVVDAGANCGAASIHFARTYPEAVVHAFEPGREALAYLRDNAADYPSISIHPVGLHERDQEVLLYLDEGDLGRSSVVPPPDGQDRHGRTETITLRSAGDWAVEAGIDRIDVLKVDVEGCEVEVLRSLASFLPGVQALYVEYDSRHARREIERLLEPTHELYFAMLQSLDQGESLYLHKDHADRPEAMDRLREIFGLLTPG